MFGSNSAFDRGSVSNGQSGGLDEGCGVLQKVLRVVARQLLLQRCSMGPLLPSAFSGRRTELQNVLHGATAAFSGRRTELQNVLHGATAAFSGRRTELQNVLHGAAAAFSERRTELQNVLHGAAAAFCLLWTEDRTAESAPAPTPLKGHSLSPRSCPPTLSAPSDRFGY